MWINIVIGALIFGYAGWTLIQHIRKSRQGICSTCGLRDECDKCSKGLEPK